MDRPIHLAICIDDLIVGGTQRWLVHLCRGLSARGFDIRVYSMRNRTHPMILKQLQDCARVEIIGESRLWRLEGLRFLAREFREWPTDILQTLLPTSDWLGRSLGRWTRIPVVMSSIRGRNAAKPWWQLALDRATARWAQAVIFNNRAGVPFALKHEGIREHQVHIIPNGVEPGDPAADGANARFELQTPPDAVVIGTIGRLHPAKSPKNLLQAFSEVKKSHPEAVLWLIGEGKERKALENEAKRLKIEKSVRMPGNRADIPQILAAMDLFVLPSNREGMPNALLEAMASGTPVIASDIDGIRELIQDGQTGRLIPPNNVPELTKAIQNALKDRKMAEKWSENAKNLVLEHFSMQKMLTDYENLYRQFLATQ